jgi:hypothetical protein
VTSTVAIRNCPLYVDSGRLLRPNSAIRQGETDGPQFDFEGSRFPQTPV